MGTNLAAFASAGGALEKTKMVRIICETHLNSEVNFKKSIGFLRFWLKSLEKVDSFHLKRMVSPFALKKFYICEVLLYPVFRMLM